MGGRGGRSSRGGGSYSSIGETVSINGYKITNGKVTSPSGISQEVFASDIRELTSQEKTKMRDALAKAGISDPVAAGKLIMPRSIAQEAIKQKQFEEHARQKNVPGLEELRTALAHDENQREKFRRSVYSGSGILKGNPSSATASVVAKKYPRASAYIKAESWSYASSDVKASLGRAAMLAIVKGKSAKTALREMEKKWDEYTRKKSRD